MPQHDRNKAASTVVVFFIINLLFFLYSDLYLLILTFIFYIQQITYQIYSPYIIYSQNFESYILKPLHPRSEPYAWQRGGEVVVDVVASIEEVHLLHSEERNTVGEETHEVGHAA